MASKGGRPSIFEGKDTTVKPVKGFVTKVGRQTFEAARKKLAKLAGWESTRVSDGDTIEYLSRGHAATAAYLKQRSGGR